MQLDRGLYGVLVVDDPGLPQRGLSMSPTDHHTGHQTGHQTGHHAGHHADPADRADLAGAGPGGPDRKVTERQGALATMWSGLTAVVGAVMGLLPHLLHHVSFLAGAALVTGVGGNLAFGALGLLFSIPLLRRLHRRFRTWKAPAAALVVFAVMFSLSAFVIGPAISGDDAPPAPAPSRDVSPDEHVEHHG